MAKKLVVFIITIFFNYLSYGQVENLEVEWFRTYNGIVMVKTKMPGADSYIKGAGIIVGINDQKKIYVATAFHLVGKNAKRCREAKVEFHFRKGQHLDATVINTQSNFDLAVLVVDASSFSEDEILKIPLDVLRPSGGIGPGFDVHHVGYPGEKWVRNIDPAKISRAGRIKIRFQAKLMADGFSGGGLFDKCGNLIGMVSNDESVSSEAVPISLILEEFRVWRYKVSLTDTNKLECVTPSVCSISIKSDPPGADIYLNNTLRGTTPATVENLNVGAEYELSLNMSGYEEYKERISCDTSDLHIPLEREKIRISSRPSGADVYVEGVLVGRTPCKISKPLAGETKNLKIKKENHRDFKRRINSTTQSVSHEFVIRTGNILVMYGSTTVCGLFNVTIKIGGRRFKPLGNPYTLRNVPLGEHEFEIEGRIQCPNGQWCNASVDGEIYIEHGASYTISWDGNASFGECSLEFTRY